MTIHPQARLLKRVQYLASGKSPRLSDVDDVRDAFHEHRGFLITSMLECQEGLDWVQTPMLNYYESNFAVGQMRTWMVEGLTWLQDEYGRIEARVLGTSTALNPASSENRDDTKKRKSQSPLAEAPQDKKARKGKAANQVKDYSPDTPPPMHALDGLSSDEDGVPDVLTRKCKSILQPSGSKTARKAADRRKSFVAVDRSLEVAHSEEENDEDSQFSEGSPITTLRTAEDLELLTNSPKEDSPGDAHGLKYLPQKYLELKVVDYDLPSMEPQGPGDLWTCSFESCFHRVHQASKLDGKARIVEHFKTHATQAREMIDLALNESRPYLPVK